jgi:hypothetical protein
MEQIQNLKKLKSEQNLLCAQFLNQRQNSKSKNFCKRKTKRKTKIKKKKTKQRKEKTTNGPTRPAFTVRARVCGAR